MSEEEKHQLHRFENLKTRSSDIIGSLGLLTFITHV